MSFLDDSLDLADPLSAMDDFDFSAIHRPKVADAEPLSKCKTSKLRSWDKDPIYLLNCFSMKAIFSEEGEKDMVDSLKKGMESTTSIFKEDESLMQFMKEENFGNLEFGGNGFEKLMSQKQEACESRPSVFDKFDLNSIDDSLLPEDSSNRMSVYFKMSPPRKDMRESFYNAGFNKNLNLSSTLEKENFAGMSNLVASAQIHSVTTKRSVPTTRKQTVSSTTTNFAPSVVSKEGTNTFPHFNLKSF